MLSLPSKRRWHMLILAILTLAMVLPGLASIPVIDRDEARFAQASVQMAETGDILNIRLQDEARNKKPAAAYWAQTAMIKTFARDGENRIWVQRIPSVLASLLTILALYWGGLRMVGRHAALIGCALLATSLIFIFEGHVAKTDALLCASTTFIFASLGRLRAGGNGKEAWVFWIALGLSIMIKGPIGPLLAVFSLLSLWLWERDLSWARPLLNWAAILVFILIWLPWGIAIYIETDGAFFLESLGKDFGGKIVSGQEGHGQPPGMHSLAIWATLWPATLFLLPGLAYAIRSVHSSGNNPITRSMRFILCWIIPFWVLIEIMPTKLPHYGLPVFPSLCLMMGTAFIAMRETKEFSKTRFINGIVFMLSTTLVIGAVLFAQSQHGDINMALPTYIISGVAGGLAITSGFALWGNKLRLSLASALLSSMIMTMGTYAFILPNLTDFKTSERIAAELKRFAPTAKSASIHSPHYREPSLIYHTGKDINLKSGGINLANRSLLILNSDDDETEAILARLEHSAKSRETCLQTSNQIKGFNYSKGKDLSLFVLREGPCEASSP